MNQNAEFLNVASKLINAHVNFFCLVIDNGSNQEYKTCSNEIISFAYNH